MINVLLLSSYFMSLFWPICKMRTFLRRTRQIVKLHNAIIHLTHKQTIKLSVIKVLMSLIRDKSYCRKIRQKYINTQSITNLLFSFNSLVCNIYIYIYIYISAKYLATLTAIYILRPPILTVKNNFEVNMKCFHFNMIITTHMWLRQSLKFALVERIISHNRVFFSTLSIRNLQQRVQSK